MGWPHRATLWEFFSEFHPTVMQIAYFNLKLVGLLVLIVMQFAPTMVNFIAEAEAVKQEEMSAYNAFKACAPVAWSPNLYITLVRGIPGTRRLHRRTLEALRLRKCNRTVMRWNTPTVRGMLQQVKRLVVIETEEMYNARKEKLANHKALRPPLVVNHHTAPAADSVQ